MSDIKCPHCGYERDADVDDYGADGEVFKDHCHECKKPFNVTVWVSTTWETECQDEDHDWTEDLPFDEHKYEVCTKCDKTRRVT